MTPKGIEKIEKGTMNWFDPEMFVNFNTGSLEQYLDEKNRREGFDIPAWSWGKVGIAILIGAIFAIVNQYVGLKVGMVVAGSWYMTYLIGMAARWKPTTLNIAATASNGAAMICTGFVFTFPAIYILALDPAEKVNNAFLIDKEILTSLMPIAISATMISGVLGVMYFIVFRRIWLVEDPLPTPGFEATVKLLDLSRATSGEASRQAKKSVKQAVFWISSTAIFTFFRDWPFFKTTGEFSAFKGRLSILDRGAMALGIDNYYQAGDIIFTPKSSNAGLFKYVFFSITLIPIQFGIGWFMKWKTATLIFLGTFFTWFVVIPIAVWTHAPYFWANSGEYFDVSQMRLLVGITLPDYEGIPTSPVFAAYSIARVMAIGTILGGGMTALIKMLPVFKTVFKDLTSTFSSEEARSKGSYIPGKGWYEWPSSHILVVMIVTGILVALVFIVGGFGVIPSIVFSIALVSLTFMLGAIAVKVMGETGTEPVSATSFLVLLGLMVLFNWILPLVGFDMTRSEVIVLSLVGTTVFAGAISMSGSVVLNFKNGLYCGNRPHDLVRGLTPGIIPGAIISGIFAMVFSLGLANGTLNLPAPQAHAFTIFVKGIIEQAIQWKIFFVGVGIGVFLELLMGMGTAFGLGMYLPIGIQIPMLAGGISRSVWEKRWLEPKVKRNNWGEDIKTMKILGTYMMATGMIVGEAVLGTFVALWIVIPLIGEIF